MAMLAILGASLPGAAVMAQGYVPDSPARLSSIPQMQRHRAYLPAQVDLSSRLPAPGMQGQGGTCAGWAVGYALGSYYSGRGPAAPLSPSYVFNQISVTPGQCLPGGASLLSALELLQRQGSVPLGEFPYSDTDCARLPGPNLQASAGRFRIGSFERLDKTRLDDVKGALAQGRPVAFGMWIDYATLEHLRPGEVYDRLRAPSAVGHAMVLAGYDDARQAFRMLNSWGESWDESGYGWISYRAFLSGVDAAFVVTSPAAARTAAAPPPVVPAVAAGGSWGEAARQLGNTLQCAAIGVDPAARRITGYVGSGADRARLGEAAPPDATLTVAVLPWPQCEAMEAIAGVPQGRSGFSIETVGHPSGQYVRGEQMVLRLRLPDHPAWLHLAYVDAAGHATILLPRAGETAPYPTGSEVVLGRDAPEQYWIDGPRFGSELLVAVVTSRPLRIAPEDTTERAYLSALKQALSGKSHVLDAAVVPLWTRATH